jgi:hypothetical protein
MVNVYAPTTWLHPPHREWSVFIFVCGVVKVVQKTTVKSQCVGALAVAVAESVYTIVGSSKVVVAHIVQMPGGCLLDLHIGDISEA